MSGLTGRVFFLTLAVAVAQLDDEKTPETESRDEADDGRVNMANALNLSDSEEEEELEDIIEDFTANVNMEVVRT